MILQGMVKIVLLSLVALGPTSYLAADTKEIVLVTSGGDLLDKLSNLKSRAPGAFVRVLDPKRDANKIRQLKGAIVDADPTILVYKNGEYAGKVTEFSSLDQLFDAMSPYLD